MTNWPGSTSLRLGALIGHLPTAVAVGLIGYAIVAGGYFVALAGFALIYAVFVTGLNVFMGYAGQATFGQNAFAAIGGYTSAVLTTAFGWPPVPALMIGICGAVLCALVIGYPTLRLKGHYLAMGTLAIGLIVYEVTVQWQSVTQGYMGISGIPPLGVGEWEAASDRAQLVLLSIVCVLCMISAKLIRNSRLGRALVALSGSEDAARALGIDVAHYKLIAFVLSAAIPGMVGAVMALRSTYFVVGQVFDPMVSVTVIAMALIGGGDTARGPVLGVLFLALMSELLWAQAPLLYMIILGAILVVFVLLVPDGVIGLAKRLRRRGAAA